VYNSTITEAFLDEILVLLNCFFHYRKGSFDNSVNGAPLHSRDDIILFISLICMHFSCLISGCAYWINNNINNDYNRIRSKCYELEYNRPNENTQLYTNVDMAKWNGRLDALHVLYYSTVYNLHSVYHDFNIRKPLCRTNLFANDFLTVASLHGTCLPSVIVNSKFVAAFKRARGSFDFSLFLNYA